MKRTTAGVLMVLFAVAAASGAALAQTPASDPAGAAAAKPDGKPAPADPVSELAAAMVAAERALVSARIELRTRSRWGDDTEVTTSGVLHVLRGTQWSVHAAYELQFADGFRGRAESAQTTDGITLYEDFPAFGESFVHVDAALVTDLEWAGRVLQRDDLPGMTDPRAQAPLGSGLLLELQRHFDLQIDAARSERQGEAGTWLQGRRKSGLDLDDPALPIADRVEVFVRSSDRALLEVVQRRGDQVTEAIEVTSLQVGLTVPAKVFRVDGRGQRLLPVKEFAPLREQIDQALTEAERRCEQRAAEANAALPPDRRQPPDVRPSRRPERR
jgi:hypothetical protein